MDENAQEKSWCSGWRPAGWREPGCGEQEFLAAHPGWMQAAWAHPDYEAWQNAQNEHQTRPILTENDQIFSGPIDRNPLPYWKNHVGSEPDKT